MTVRVARAAFLRGSLAIRIRDELGVLFRDEQFTGLFPVRGKPAFSPGRLAMVSVLQFAEGLPDRQAAQAVRGRIDWKYALGLELTDPGFDYSVLSEFRARLVEADGGERIFSRFLRRPARRGCYRCGDGRGRTPRMCWRQAGGSIAWSSPSRRCGRRELAEQAGTDGMRLMESVFAGEAPGWLRELPAVQVLRRARVQESFVDGEGRVRWRDPKDRPPGGMCLASPYDVDVRYGKKVSTINFFRLCRGSCDVARLSWAVSGCAVQECWGGCCRICPVLSLSRSSERSRSSRFARGVSRLR